MEGVKDIVNSKNKDIFTHNLSGFRKEVIDYWLKIIIYSMSLQIELLMRGQKDPTNESAEEDTQFMTD
jgi:hypothetical protein